MRRAPLGFLVAVLAALSFGPAPASAAGPKCGVGPAVDDGMGGKVFLSGISQRRNISCRTAQRVIKAAKRRGTNVFVCGTRRRRSAGWTLRHAGSRSALSTRWTNGKRSFVVSEQGAC